MRVLIVDDTTFMRTTIKRMLEQQNITETFEAENGMEALTKYKILRPQLVIMDISMPVMDGIEATHLIRAFDAQANILICSLQGQKANVMEAIKAGARSFLVKPIKEEKLLAEIAKIARHLPKESEEVQEALSALTDSADDTERSEDYLRGIEAGYLEARREIAANMARLGISTTQISSCVEMTEEEIEDLKVEYKLGF